MKTNTTENPWAEGMKGSHDASWIGRFWRGIARVVNGYCYYGAPAVRVVNQEEKSTVSVADELEKLLSLKERGVLSSDEFESQKQSLLKRQP